MAKLGDFIVEITEKTTENNQHPVLTSSREGLVDQNEYFNKQVASKDNTGYKIIHRGQFTYRAMSDTGKFYINQLKCNDIGIVSPAYPVFEVKPDSGLSPEYLQEYFKTDLFQHAISLQSSGSTRVSLKLNKLKDIDIAIPSMVRQNLIVNNLARLREIIENRRSQLRLLDELVKSRFIEMFGDPKSNPNSYPISQLSEHIKFLTSGSRGWAQYCVDNGSEWFITIKNVKDCRISIDNMQPINAPDNAEAKRTKVQEGDLLISITADLGRTGVVTKEIADHGAYINQHLTCIRLNKEILNPMYVAFFMESPAGKEQFESKNQSAVKAGLNFNSINSLRLLVPPLELQNQFADFVALVDKSKLAVQKSLEQLEILKKALMQAYFG